MAGSKWEVCRTGSPGGSGWRVLLWLGCPSAFTGLKFVVQLLEAQLKIIKEPPCLVRAGPGVEAEPGGTLSVLHQGTDGCSQRLCQVPSRAGGRARVPAGCWAPAEKTSLAALALPCFTSPLLPRPLKTALLAPSPVSVGQGGSALVTAPLSGPRPVPRHGVSLGEWFCEPRVLPAPGQSPVAQGAGEGAARLARVRRGRLWRRGWFETERCLRKGTPWLESPEGCGNWCSVVPRALWKTPDCETLGNARTLLLRGVCAP